MTHWHLTWHGTVAPYVRRSQDMTPNRDNPGPSCQRMTELSGKPHNGIIECGSPVAGDGLCDAYRGGLRRYEPIEASP